MFFIFIFLLLLAPANHLQAKEMKLHYQGAEQHANENNEKQTFEYNGDPEEEITPKPLSTRVSQYISNNADLIVVLSLIAFATYWYISSHSTKIAPQPPKKPKRPAKTQHEYEAEARAAQLKMHAMQWQRTKRKFGLTWLPF